MAKYLEKFSSILGKVQTEQVLRLLNQKRDTGQVRSIKEFSKELETLIRELTSTGLTPSLKLYLAEEFAQTSSEEYNFMLDRVQDDLEAAFQEAIQIDTVQVAHEAIVKDVVLKNIRAGLAELDRKITLYEFLNGSSSGFDKAVFSSFAEIADNRTNRGDEDITVIFEDPRTSELLDHTEDARIDPVGDRLLLPSEQLTFHEIRGIRQIFDNTTPQSELIVEPPGTKITNLIDGTKGTYWVQSLLFAEKRNEVKIKIELNLGGVKEINFIEIDPATRQNAILETVEYLDVNSQWVDLEIDEQAINGSLAFPIRRTITNKLIFTFKNTNLSRLDFEYKDGVGSLLDQALTESIAGETPEMQLVAEDLDTFISSAKIKEAIGWNEKEDSTFSGYGFTTGFDNFRVGLNTYSDRGLYASKPISGSLLGECGLRATEMRPYKNIDGVVRFTSITYDLATRTDLDDSVFFSDADSIYLLGSIEYWVTKQDFDSKGNVIDTSTFPILPLGVNRIYHERLVMAEKSATTRAYNDIGYSLFFTNVSDGDLKVYRNGTLLIQDVGWSLVPVAALATPDSGSRMTTKIKISDPSPGDYYTISYTPLESSTRSIPSDISEFTSVGGLQTVDLVGDLSARLVDGKEVIFDYFSQENKNGSTRLFLTIILRRNTSEKQISPVVEEYALLAGVKDESKLES